MSVDPQHFLRELFATAIDAAARDARIEWIGGAMDLKLA